MRRRRILEEGRKIGGGGIRGKRDYIRRGLTKEERKEEKWDLRD